MPMPWLLASRGLARCDRRPCDQIAPAVRLIDAGEDAASASTCRRRSRRPGRRPRRGRTSSETSLSAWTPGKRFVDVAQRQRERRRRGRAHLTIRMARSIESATATMIMRPCTPAGRRAGCPSAPCRCEHDDDQHADQGLQHAALPPDSAVPPTTTAVIVVNSRPWPICALPRPSCAAAKIAAERVEDAGEREGRDPHAARP